MIHRAIRPGLLIAATTLVAACPRDNGDPNELITVPQCNSARQLLSTDQNGRLICKSLPTLSPPDCKQYSEAFTSDGKQILCANRNQESVASYDALNNLESSEQLINDYTTRLGKLAPAPPGGLYCGQTPVQPNAAFAVGTARGIDAAAKLCQQLAACGSRGHMCTVYEMYNSAAQGVINANITVSSSWVYMAGWSQEFSDNSGAQKEPGAGLADNCGGYTVADSARNWYGTAIAWKVAVNGDKALTAAGGSLNVGIPGTTSIVANANAVSCSAMLPIACCK